MRAFVVGNYMNANFLHVPHLPRAGQSIAAEGVFREHGGKGLNLAAGLYRLGVRTDLLMAVGRDDVGAAATDFIRGLGMATDFIRQVEAPSGFGVGFIAPDGANFLSAFMGANLLLSADHVRAAEPAVRAADWVLAQFEAPDAPILEAFRIARAAGLRTYLNPSPWREPDDRMLDLIDLLVVNQTEAAMLFAEPDAVDWTARAWIEKLPALGRERIGRGCLVVVTLAAEGSVALTGEGAVLHAPAYRIEQVDATGAGDAFGAGLVWSLGRGTELARALREANACGALVARSRGILDRLADEATLSRFIRERTR
ncbi:ribokinase [Rhodoblastus acidophilus]|uniref:Ribokinase n=1 Tax=Candidatus Rhodoblastus alkanivorans TaxID=2954117 RepID=A0ABS9Z8C4_9HYPH|nr:ribokinase [Candidatus Rhodoblastus alkanivorans]MCI4679655.1 ribokinase [Candidatus Rhodoblastus alkanivorans]MCI4683691.1 ribokinase [Candidatus Rhodoblastus alkanivorans]MDI4641008.1 ribokinase [Rhodoblastus acidophilus]